MEATRCTFQWEIEELTVRTAVSITSKMDHMSLFVGMYSLPACLFEFQCCIKRGNFHYPYVIGFLLGDVLIRFFKYHYLHFSQCVLLLFHTPSADLAHSLCSGFCVPRWRHVQRAERHWVSWQGAWFLGASLAAFCLCLTKALFFSRHRSP